MPRENNPSRCDVAVLVDEEVVERDASGEPTGVHQWLMYASQAFTRGAEASPLAR